ncbi:MAG: GNAT family N-acetyltransferase [Chloroflexi bacterium]|nr:GNAT family N-acetyltransferase [Chloroflexota bacterium]MCH7655314.1 GNAT family N-acetyltransferase [Chloroflexota bacterium]
MLVRPATNEDAEAVFEMLGDFATSYVPERAAFDRSYPAIVARQEGELLVAEDNRGVVGYILAADMATLFANGPVTELLELYVKPSSRGEGIGKSLVGTAVRGASQRGAVEVTVPTRRARGFYLAMGFESTAEYFKVRPVDAGFREQ